MDTVENSSREVQEAGEIVSQFLNAEQAKAYANSLEDQAIREVFWYAYSVLLFKMAPKAPEGQFDLLFFAQLVTELFNDRDRLIELLHQGSQP
jgi:hypothetical protein